MHDPFPSTAWSAVQYQSSQGSEGARRALTRLYEMYWSPLYAYLRRRGMDAHQSEDLLQSFYAFLFERDIVSSLDRDRGLLRSFLLTALRNYLHDHWERERAQRRSPVTPPISLDVLAEENHYQAIADTELSPDEVFELRWASSMAARARRSLAMHERAAGNDQAFELLQEHVFGGVDGLPYQDVATVLGVSVSAIKLRVHRYRKRLGRLLRHEIERTVADPSSVDSELRHMLDTLSKAGGG